MAERPILQAVVFDAGGTLVRLDFEWMSTLLTTFGLSIGADELRRAEVAGRRAYDASRGVPAGPCAPPPALGSVGDIRAYFGGMLDSAGVPAAHRDPVLARFAERHEATGLWTRPMEGARETIDRLTGMGLPMAVVSNSDGRAEMHLRDCDVRRGLSFVVDSHPVGVEKPDPAIFRIALTRLAVSAEHALYVGDIVSVDQVGARAAGMPVVLIDPAGDYAPPGTHSIRGVHDLAPWILDHFTPVRAAVDPASARES